jgi:hypothetical protein
LVFPEISVGMIEAPTTRNFLISWTRSQSSTSADGHVRNAPMAIAHLATEKNDTTTAALVPDPGAL